MLNKKKMHFQFEPLLKAENVSDYIIHACTIHSIKTAASTQQLSKKETRRRTAAVRTKTMETSLRREEDDASGHFI